MKRFALALIFFLCAPLAMLAQQGAPEIPFDSVNPVKMPENMYLGEVAGVALDSKGNIYIFNRGNTTGPAYAAAAAQLAGIRSQRQIHARNRPQPVRMVVRARRAH